jgi:tRNA pseudouridine55 synthase
MAAPVRPPADSVAPPGATGAGAAPAGLLLVDKPAGITSHDVVGAVRRAVRSRRVGHAGTLDPFATGLLVVAVGPVTRLLPWIVGEPKVYLATIRFGAATDTDDATGSVVREAEVPAAVAHAPFADASLRQAMDALTGPLRQRPPAYSAKHVDGTRAYALARRGTIVDLPPVPVMVHGWELLGQDGTDLRVRITCGGGTYIRALARDLGEALGSAAHCATLRRERSGPLSVQEAVPYEAVTPGALAAGGIRLVSPLDALGPVAREPLDAAQVAAVRQGRMVAATQPGERAALLDRGEVVAMAERRPGAVWQPRVVLAGGHDEP